VKSNISSSLQAGNANGKHRDHSPDRLSSIQLVQPLRSCSISRTNLLGLGNIFTWVSSCIAIRTTPQHQTQLVKQNIRDLCRTISAFKKSYKPNSNLVKEENGELLADSDNSLSRWKNYFPQLLNVHSVSDIRQR
jgi:hypothetical protein